MSNFLIIPLLLPLITLGLPLAGKLLTDLFKKQIPKRYRPLCPLALGALASGAAILGGLPPEQVMGTGIGVGLGSIGLHEVGEMITGARVPKD